MYGQKVAGVTVDSELTVLTALMEKTKELAESEDFETLKSLPSFKRLRVDNMGREIIIY